MLCALCDDDDIRRIWLSLHLQVYGPSNIHKLKPVMVFFYGGSFNSGSSSIPIYNGQSIGSYSRDTVVVAANYRLGALGFLASTSSLRRYNTTGNLGLLDQVAALEWVQARVTDFGGDPSQVTIFGESAGGASVCALMTMPIANGLFSRAIVESGVCQDAQTLGPQYALANALARQLSCVDGNDTTCLDAQSWQSIVAAQSQIAGNPMATTMWSPTIDHTILADIPIVSMMKKQVNPSVQAVMIGTNANESNIFLFTQAAERALTVATLDQRVLAVVNGDQQRAQQIVAAYLPSQGLSVGGLNVTAAALAYASMLTDRVFVCTANAVIRALIALQLDVYAYSYRHQPSCSFIDQGILPIMGAFHGSELPFVFSVHSSRTCSITQLEEYLSYRMVSYWTSFAHGDVPMSTLDGTVGSWPLANVSPTGVITTVALDAPYDSIVTGNREAYCKLWT